MYFTAHHWLLLFSEKQSYGLPPALDEVRKEKERKEKEKEEKEKNEDKKTSK